MCVRSAPWIVSALLLTSVGGCAFRPSDYSANRRALIPAAGASVLKLDVGSGYLRVEGQPESGQIVISGIAHASSAEALDSVRLITTRVADTIIVSSAIPARSRQTPAAASLDLEIQLPANLALVVRDSAGESVFRRTGPIRIVHGDGSLKIDGVAGNLDVTDGEGDMVISNVTGSVRIIDGAGGIFLSRIGGSVLIPRAGSGEVQLVDISGDVTIGSKHSGEVAARGVGGNLAVTSSGNGSIEYRDVRGSVAFPMAGGH